MRVLKAMASRNLRDDLLGLGIAVHGLQSASSFWSSAQVHGEDKLVTFHRVAVTSAGLGERGDRLRLVTGVASSLASDGAAAKRSAATRNPIRQQGREMLPRACHGVRGGTEDLDLEATAAGARVSSACCWPANPDWGTVSSHPIPRKPWCEVPGTPPRTIGNPSCWSVGDCGR